MAQLSKTLKAYRQNTGGQFAVQFAVLAFPLMLMTSFVMDYSSAGAEKIHIKSALDAAVIATVNNNSLTKSQKEDYAVKHFQENYDGKVQLKLDPKIDGTRVEMNAAGLAPVTIAEAIGIKGVAIQEKSVAELTSENVICALSLAPDGSSRISFAGKMKFLAPTCSVHSNSTNAQALWSSGSSAPIAKNFCSSGGSKGRFQPYAKGDCAPVEDPYKYHSAPANTPCINIGSIGDARTNPVVDPITGLPMAAATAPEDFGGGGGGGGIENLTGSNVALLPGTYCGGLTVDGTNVRFLPGNHIMLDGPLIFRNNANAIAEDVTFVMKGNTSLLNIESGASVDIKARGTGPLAGLAFFQDVSSSTSGSALPNGLNYLASGGILNVTGTVYFPTQTVEVAGKSVFGSNAPATSFIAYNIDFYGGPTINISVDHQRAGLPPIMPRTEDGARLVQ